MTASIQYGQFVALLECVGAHLSDKECHIHCLYMDTDGDGSIGIQEFAAGWID